MKRESPADFLPRGKRYDEPKAEHYRASRCELRACRCGGHGKPDIAIQVPIGTVIGWVCQLGYIERLTSLERDTSHTWKPTGSPINQDKQVDIEAKGFHRFADIVTELDRYADSVHDREDV